MSLFQTLIPALNRTAARAENTAASELGSTVKPAYEIKETADAYGVTVFLPGVSRDDINV